MLIATDLPEPVVPATSRWGMRARSTITGSPPIVLPSARAGVVRSAEVLAGEQFAQVDRLAALVRQLDADGVLARNDRDAGGDGAHRAGDVVGEADDARRLDAGRGLQLVEGDHRAGADVDDLALDAEIVEHAFEQPRVLLERVLRDLCAGRFLRLGRAARSVAARLAARRAGSPLRRPWPRRAGAAGPRRAPARPRRRRKRSAARSARCGERRRRRRGWQAVAGGASAPPPEHGRRPARGPSGGPVVRGSVAFASEGLDDGVHRRGRRSWTRPRPLRGHSGQCAGARPPRPAPSGAQEDAARARRRTKRRRARDGDGGESRRRARPPPMARPEEAARDRQNVADHPAEAGLQRPGPGRGKQGRQGRRGAASEIEAGFRRGRPRRRCAKRRQAQMTGGTRSSRRARPRNCMARSATTAPGGREHCGRRGRSPG